MQPAMRKIVRWALGFVVLSTLYLVVGFAWLAKRREQRKREERRQQQTAEEANVSIPNPDSQAISAAPDDQDGPDDQDPPSR